MQRRAVLGVLVFAGIVLGLLAITRWRRSEEAVAPGGGAARDTALAVPGQAAAASLDSAARGVIGFLQGQAAFDDAAYADTVRLYMNPEGDVVARTLPRSALRTRSNWTLQWGRGSYSLTPPATHTEVTTRVGRHFRCFEEALAARIPALGDRPHVGVRLEPPGADSCLQVWNLTFVFEDGARPRVVAVVYDQFEW